MPAKRDRPTPPPATSGIRLIVTRSVVVRLLLGWACVIGIGVAGGMSGGGLSSWALAALLVGIVAVIVVCSFGVVTQAEHLAHRLGDPFGTVVLTLSIVAIEAILISAVMLGPGDHTTIARDAVFAAAMIVLTLVVGLALVVGGSRREGDGARGDGVPHGGLRVNRAGLSMYMTYLVVLLALAFAVPGALGHEGSYTRSQSMLVLTLVVGAYTVFLWQQLGAQRAYFQEVGLGDQSNPAHATHPTQQARAARPAPNSVGVMMREHGREVVVRVVVLLAMVAPIVGLSHTMAGLLDDALTRMDAPLALSGLLIGVIVFLPEGITTVRAARSGEGQRVSNLAHGALVSCVGLTLPVVLFIALVTNQTVVLGLRAVDLVLLVVGLVMNVTTFMAGRANLAHGVAHLLVFVVYLMSIMA